MVLAAFVISIIALVVAIMALPTIFQMIWGKPKLMILFGVKEIPDGKILQCELVNPPIRNKLLKRLGIRRVTAEDIMGRFYIEEYGSRRVVFPGEVPKIITHNGTEGHQRIGLAASFFPAIFGIVLSSYTDKRVYVFEEQETVLPPGKYCACIHVTMEGKPFEKQRNFVVSQTHPFAYWD